MQHIASAEFEPIVAKGIEAIPPEFLSKLKNVAITISDEPTPAQRVKARLGPGGSLFGLYEGVPQTARAANYSLVPPDKITIFRNALVLAARDAEDLADLVRDTVWHEIAHHFGMNEKEVRNAEGQRKHRLER